MLTKKQIGALKAFVGARQGFDAVGIAWVVIGAAGDKALREERLPERGAAALGPHEATLVRRAPQGEPLPWPGDPRAHQGLLGGLRAGGHSQGALWGRPAGPGQPEDGAAERELPCRCTRPPSPTRSSSASTSPASTPAAARCSASSRDTPPSAPKHCHYVPCWCMEPWLTHQKGGQPRHMHQHLPAHHLAACQGTLQS